MFTRIISAFMLTKYLPQESEKRLTLSRHLMRTARMKKHRYSYEFKITAMNLTNNARLFKIFNYVPSLKLFNFNYS